MLIFKFLYDSRDECPPKTQGISILSFLIKKRVYINAYAHIYINANFQIE